MHPKAAGIEIAKLIAILPAQFPNKRNASPGMFAGLYFFAIVQAKFIFFWLPIGTQKAERNNRAQFLSLYFTAQPNFWGAALQLI
jgi:hypothetical protein